MTSKLLKQCTTTLTCLLIIILVTVNVTVWIMYAQGAFRSTNPKKQQNFITTIAEKSQLRKMTKETLIKSHLDDIDQEMEFVKPLKISPLPLHDHDIIFDQLHNNHDGPTLRHHSGHFRHKMAKIWDPHPNYEIRAFGRTLLLELEDDNAFLGPNLHITQIWHNYTKRIRHDPRISGCFYTGKIKGDENSKVAVSLCNGMTGYIRTSDGNYYIEPAEKFVINNKNEEKQGKDEEKLPLIRTTFLHRIKKMPNNFLNDNHETNEQCETTDNSKIIEDDDFEIINDISPTTTTTTTTMKSERRKRSVLYFDDINTEEEVEDGGGLEELELESGDEDDNEEDEQESYRTTRDADYWNLNINNNFENKERTNEYYVKVLVVTDKTMIKYHQNNEELQHYLLILMSQVALLYKDASIGNAISVSVVNILMLNDIEFASSNSQVMLREFCEWQEKNTYDRQHDVAILLTRSIICKNTQNKRCTTLGVAEVGSMCTLSSSCAIISDRGLSSSYTITHELGHVFSMPHDDDKRCQQYQKGSKQNNIMSKLMYNNTKPWVWSKCSRHFITEFLDSSKAKCLLKKPSQDYLTSKFSQILPGERFEANRQCELEYGTGSKICSFMPQCISLWCTNELGEDEGCVTKLMPWAEGTSCGYRHWCHHGDCIALDRQLLTPIAGGWGPWQPWGVCSRTCGGGVKMSKRNCDSPVPENGGVYCIGRAVRYVSCNPQSCVNNEPDFREMQCTEFNGKTRMANLSNNVEWIPKYGFLDEPEKLCRLYCRPKNSQAYYLLKDKVIDGTKCGLNSFNICVNGICRPGGCDNKLESNITLDECGICGGDNSKCEEVTGKYNLTLQGYNHVIRIPKGSSNLDIRQNNYRKNNIDDNYLALVDGDTNEYLLNGNYVVSTHQKDIIFGAMIINYSGSSAFVERITTPKNYKLTKDLIVEILSVGDLLPPGITYRYIISRDNAPRYGWRLYQKEWTKCNSICAGIQTMNPICVELSTNKQQSDSYCNQLDRQITKRDCNTHCQLIWNVVSHGACSVNCGKGIRSVHYNCVKIDLSKENYLKPNINREIVNDKHCGILPKPPNLETCHGQCDSTRWEYTKWSECSTSCGGGIQRRQANCVDNHNQKIDNTHCVNLEKITEQICNSDKCPVWSEEWTPCSVTCGRGIRTRPYYCHVDGRIYNPAACDQTRQFDTEQCHERPCESWITGQWSKCSAICGNGVQTRSVTCHNIDNTQLDEYYCRDILKPNNSRTCNLGNCDDDVDNNINGYNNRNGQFNWVTGAWSECSKTCDTGYSTRIVVCRNEYGEESAEKCNQNLRPIAKTECKQIKCPIWQFTEWSECNENCEKFRHVNCQHSNGNYIDNLHCNNGTKPKIKEKCKLNQCPNQTRINRNYFDSKEDHDKRRYQWKIGKWKQCSNACGKGIRRRHIDCIDTLNDVNLVDEFCQYIKKPKTTKPCERYNCKFTWIEHNWSDCTKSCDEGYKIRNVTCHKVYNGGIVDPTPLPSLNLINRSHHNNYCDFYNRPTTMTTCTLSKCGDKFMWRPGPWSDCSHQCGKKGRQIRQLYCVNVKTGEKVQKMECPKKYKPPKKRKCNQWKCLFRNCKEIQNLLKTKLNKDYLMKINDKTALIYCYKMDTNEPEEYISLKNDYLNYAENYDKRLINTQTCPFDGQRQNNCNCLQIEPNRSGLTTFWKIRLNVTSLRVKTNDYTFSRQTQGMQIPYGTAGDCYSSVEGCALGTFSIDLTNTSFRISDKVIWKKIGNYASAQIHILENGRQIRGKCGGYCGNCIPDPSVGLEVEII